MINYEWLKREQPSCFQGMLSLELYRLLKELEENENEQ